MEEEIRFHLDKNAEDLVRQGVPPHEARRRARMEFGGISRIRGECREARGPRLLDDLQSDCRHALAFLHRRPVYTSTVLVILATTIGATTAVFSVVYSTLLEPVPYDEPDQLVAFWNGVEPSRSDVLNADAIDELRAASRSFAAVGLIGVTARPPFSVARTCSAWLGTSFRICCASTLCWAVTSHPKTTVPARPRSSSSATRTGRRV
jgi:hypothetical protein